MNKEELKQKISVIISSETSGNYKIDEILNLIEFELEKEIERIIIEVEDRYPYKQLGNRDSYSQYNEGWSDACDVIRQSLIHKE